MNTLPDFFSPPLWFVQELHNRLVLLLNHILQQDNEAMQRLARQKGRVVKFAWQQYGIALTPTAVGLLAVASMDEKPDLLLEVTDSVLPEIGQKLVRGDKPNVRIEGDIQLAAEVQWLVQNVKWDFEDDLARVVGDVPAHHMAKVARELQSKLREWLTSK
jgi:ubiquinone biosynthesis accessory factor UbiJ